jgi:hypothetical protein
MFPRWRKVFKNQMRERRMAGIKWKREGSSNRLLGHQVTMIAHYYLLFNLFTFSFTFPLYL